MAPYSALKTVFGPSQPSNDSPLNNLISSGIPHDANSAIERSIGAAVKYFSLFRFYGLQSICTGLYGTADLAVRG